MLEQSEIAERLEICKDALDRLLGAIVSGDANRTPTPLADAAARTARPAQAIPPRGILNLELLIRDPVGTACRSEIRRVGQEIFRLSGSIGAMRLAAEEVAERDPAKFGRRASILDGAWNGIGEGDQRWWS